MSGTSNADVAVLVVDAKQGIGTQTRRHACLVSLLGIRHLLLAINKMDLVNHDQRVLRAIQSDFQATTLALGFESVTAIPISALKGDNLTTRSARPPWHTGPTLIACLEAIEVQRASDAKVVFPVQWINRPDAGFTASAARLYPARLQWATRFALPPRGKPPTWLGLLLPMAT
nr:hypothetical protein FFPRI1PSEUD_61250 [Pseudomonas sp. FFPRI_1]